MKTFLSWLITSSADPAKTSLAFRGLLMLAVPYILQFGPLACSLVAALCFDLALVQPVVDWLVSAVEVVLTLVGMVMVAYGVIRKVYYNRFSAAEWR